MNSHQYRAMRDLVLSMDDALPCKFEVTKEGIVHDRAAGVGRHELTTLVVRKRLEHVMPEAIVAHTGKPDVEDETEGIMRRPDVMVIAETEIVGEGALDPRTLIAAIEDVTIGDWTISTDDLPRYKD
ncbi:hypothetical protein ACIRP7_03080 [Streptomyces sp. NPDC102270]|uniref:hypothetical protein n=1 Tax=Streptomyces sp. NPDC102270 TaxID=3366150 RepID=UPI0037F1B720